jgi:dTDP-4-amino-4,6-dideoxygalactose transaminase
MKRIFLSPPHVGKIELELVKEAFESNYIAPQGPQVDAFEKSFSEYTGIEHCVALSSGTAAIHLVLRHLGIGPGDEVIASTLTFIGSVTPILFLGAKPVFIDSDRKSWNMDPVLLYKSLRKLSKRGRLPKAVLPTDLYGQCADYDRIFDICEPYNIPVIIDAAEAMGAIYIRKGTNGQFKNKDSKQKIEHHAGYGAKAAAFSFNGNKIITTSGGGMLASDDKELIEHARLLSQQARDPFPHYEHSEIGYNYRMSNILAAIGCGQLKVLDERVKRRREIFKYYKDALIEIPGIEFMPEASYNRSNRWLTVVLISPDEFGANRERVRQMLEENNIESRPIWKPMHLQPVFRYEKNKGRYRSSVVGGEVAEDLFDRGLCLPSGTAMTHSDQDRIIDIVRKCHQN